MWYEIWDTQSNNLISASTSMIQIVSTVDGLVKANSKRILDDLIVLVFLDERKMHRFGTIEINKDAY